MADLIAVVRSVGERTESACVRRIKAQCERVEVLRNVTPFPAAVRQCFSLAIDAGAAWLLTVDADVLPDPKLVRHMMHQARDLRGWQITGRVYCRLYGGERMAGVRLYRVSVLGAVMPHVTDLTARPEGTLARLFAGWEPSNAVMGRHDDEQWMRDYHRKGLQHREKHPDWTKRAASWRASGKPDLMAAAQGWYGEPLTVPEREEYRG